MRWLAENMVIAGLLTAVVVVPCCIAGGGADSPAASTEKSNGGEEADPMGANAGCYVCHMTFVKEDLAKVHLAAKVTCVRCHGTSDKHANDENIGATKPDITYKRSQVDASCVKCHERHDAPARKVVGRFIERRLPASATPICTECHGMHKIERGKQ